MNVVKIVEDYHNKSSRPYRVMVNGRFLLTRRGSYRRFETSFAAGLAGAREVDKRR